MNKYRIEYQNNHYVFTINETVVYKAPLHSSVQSFVAGYLMQRLNDLEKAGVDTSQNSML